MKKNILGFKLCAEAEKNFQTPWPQQLWNSLQDQMKQKQDVIRVQTKPLSISLELETPFKLYFLQEASFGPQVLSWS